MATDVSICSKALLRLGAQSIASFSEGTNGPLCAEIFPELKQRVLTAAPWRFNTIKLPLLTRTITTPPTQYKYEYELPANMLTGLPRTVWNYQVNHGHSAPFTDFDIFENKLLTSAEQVFIDCQIDKETTAFPPHLVTLTIYAIMAEIAFVITDQQNTADSAQVAAWGLPGDRGRGGYFKEAQRIDSQGHPSQSIHNFPLATARFAG